jgi:hypothetical protein
MDISFGLSVAATIAGLIMYYVASNKTMEVGRLMFFAGLLATLLKIAGRAGFHISG